MAAIGIVTTPSAVADAIGVYRSDHRLGFLGFVGPIAFGIRFATIYVFRWLWWKTRPEKAS